MTYKADRIAWAAEAIAVFQRNSMSGSLHQIHCDVERQHLVEQGCLAIEMMLVEPTLRDLFATVFEQSEPQQRSEDPGLHRVCGSVPRSGKHRGLRDGAEPCQLLAGLPVGCRNR